jgi:class 3 adenylate cyclase
MELLADRDPEEARALLDPVLEKMMEAVHHYEGTVNQAMGDGIMALFGAPVAQEDHAVRACYAALRMQETVKRYAEGVFRTHGLPVQMRVGLNSGEVVVRSIGSDMRVDYTAVGHTTHLAARMQQMATPGIVLVTPATLALAEGFVQVASRGPVAVKGFAEPIEVFWGSWSSREATLLRRRKCRGAWLNSAARNVCTRSQATPGPTERLARSTTRLAMPMLVLSGEKAGGTFLIEQAKLVASDVTGQVVPGVGQWLMEEAPAAIIPAITDFVR